MLTRREILTGLALTAALTAIGKSRPAQAAKAAGNPALGVHLPLWHQGHQPAGAYWHSLFKQLKQQNIHEAQILIYRFVDPVTGQIRRKSRFKDDAAPDLSFLSASLPIAAEHGIRASLYPMLEIDNNKEIGTVWRGFLNFFGITLTNFFNQYQSFILELAKISTSHQAPIFYIGSELASLTHNIAARPHWEQLIHQLTRHISLAGQPAMQLSYAAHWEEYLTVPFWRQLDAIGINAYFPLSPGDAAAGLNGPDRSAMVKVWQKNLNDLKNFADLNKRPLAISEFGLTPFDGTTARPWAQAPSTITDTGEQHRAYSALFEVIENQADWLKAVNLWHWQMPNRLGSNYNIAPDSDLGRLISNYASSTRR